MDAGGRFTIEGPECGGGEGLKNVFRREAALLWKGVFRSWTGGSGWFRAKKKGPDESGPLVFLWWWGLSKKFF